MYKLLILKIIFKKVLRFQNVYDILTVYSFNLKQKRDNFMFGYVTVGNNQMTEEEYTVFSSYYCGVCKATGKVASQMSRLGLSYDITFLALVLSSLTADTESSLSRCIVHPFKKRRCVKDDRAVSYAAAAGVVLTYLKLKDDWKDDKSIKALIGMLGFYRGCRKAKKLLDREYEIIEKQLAILSEYEKCGSSSIDDTAEAFGKILECLLTPEFITDEKHRRTLGWLGFNLGRWIYMIDAVNDLEEDVKSGSYNPFIKMGYTELAKCAEDMELSLTLTLDGIATSFELTDFKLNREVIAKIIYISLKEKQYSILRGERKDNNESVRSSRSSRKCRRRNRQKGV